MFLAIKNPRLRCSVHRESFCAYRAKFVELVQLNQISPNIIMLEYIAKIFKNQTAVEMADATIDALSKIPVKKSEFLKDALDLVERVSLYKEKPDLLYFNQTINELVEEYSKDF
jgi:hypothetical protein